MNKARRKQISEVIERLQAISTDLEEIAGEEQEYFDNMPEGFQQCGRGQRAEEVAADIDCAAQSVNDLVSDLENCI
jgi:hypothetical protein